MYHYLYLCIRSHITDIFFDIWKVSLDQFKYVNISIQPVTLSKHKVGKYDQYRNITETSNIK